MALTARMVTIDCTNPKALVPFWEAALGYQLSTEFGGDDYMILTPVDGKGLWISLQRVPEPRVGKNRVHLDFLAPGPLQDEVDRLATLGASVLDTHVVPGFTWTVMADPEGTVFCVGQMMAAAQAEGQTGTAGE